MKRELTACAAMVRLAFQTRTNQGSNWLTWCIAALVLLVPALAFAVSGKLAPSIGAGAGIPLALLAALWWTLLVSSLAQQRSHTTRLVPGSGRRAVAVMLAGGTLITLVLTVLFALAGASALTAARLIVLALSIAAASAVVPHFAPVLFGLIIVQAFFSKWLASAFPSLLDDVLVPLAPVLILGLGYAALRAVYVGSQQADFAVALRQRARWVQASGKGQSAWFARALRRDCAEGRVAALLMHAVGPAGRAPKAAFFAAGAVILLLVTYVAPARVAYYNPLLRGLIPALMVALQVVVASTIVQAVYKARREQALVRLAPRAPAAHALNALLARSLLVEYGRCWLGSTMLALASLYFLGVDGAVLLRVVAVFLVTLTWGNLLLRDYSSERGANGSAMARIMILLGACALVLAAPITFFRAGPWLAVGCAVLVAGAALAFQRWNRMLRAPAAFPAARAR